MADGLVEYFFPAHKLTYTASAAVVRGQVVELTGNRTVAPAAIGSVKKKGVALNDALVTEPVTVAFQGVWPVIAGVAVAAGDHLVVAGAAGKVGPAGAAPDARTLLGSSEEAILLNAAGRVKVGH